MQTIAIRFPLDFLWKKSKLKGAEIYIYLEKVEIYQKPISQILMFYYDN